jgi:hypothetical protein
MFEEPPSSSDGSVQQLLLGTRSQSKSGDTRAGTGLRNAV